MAAVFDLAQENFFAISESGNISRNSPSDEVQSDDRNA
jgi:hypothetical protein